MSRPVLKRQDINEAAMKLFVEKGIEGTTTREIAILAKAGEGTMFRHYKSKEDLAWHLFDSNLSRFVKELEDLYASNPSTKERIRATVQKCYSLFETDQVLCSYLLLSEHTATRRMPPNYKTPISVLVKAIEEGQAKGEVRSLDLQMAGGLVVGAILRIPIFKIYRRIEKDLRTMVDEVTESVWKMIEKHPSAVN